VKKAYLDASAFFKIFFGEAGAERMEKVIQIAKERKLIIVISDWVINECMWAAVKKRLDEKISQRDAAMIINLMAEAVNEGLEAGYVAYYAINEKVIVTSRVLIEEGHMHPSDALHVILANASQCDYFLTADMEIIKKIKYVQLSMIPIYIHERAEIDKFFEDILL
jgi:predicted nucleic acid-binding protein